MEPPGVSHARVLHEEQQDVPGEGSADFCPCSGLGLMPVLLGEVLPSFPGSERGKLALSWVLGVKKELEAPKQEGRCLVRSGILRASSAFWELQLGGCCAGDGIGCGNNSCRSWGKLRLSQRGARKFS